MVRGLAGHSGRESNPRQPVRGSATVTLWLPVSREATTTQPKATASPRQRQPISTAAHFNGSPFQRQPIAAAGPAAEGSRKLRGLVVDDYSLVAMNSGRMREDLGQEVVVVPSGAPALGVTECDGAFDLC